jgi:hypothetical protein
MKFFQDSNFSTFQKMWSTMESTKPSVFTSSNNEGRERVQKGNKAYAFLMESTPLEYITGDLPKLPFIQIFNMNFVLRLCCPKFQTLYLQKDIAI